MYNICIYIISVHLLLIRAEKRKNNYDFKNNSLNKRYEEGGGKTDQRAHTVARLLYNVYIHRTYIIRICKAASF